MNDKNSGRVHWSFWVIGAAMLVWNALGCINFLVQMNPHMLEVYRESEQAIIENRPIWATGAFAIAVFAGAIGCLLLMFRKSFSHYVLIASMMGVVVTMVHALNVGIDFGLGEILGVIVMPLLVAVFLVWYSKQAKAKGWIR